MCSVVGCACVCNVMFMCCVVFSRVIKQRRIITTCRRLGILHILTWEYKNMFKNEENMKWEQQASITPVIDRGTTFLSIDHGCNHSMIKEKIPNHGSDHGA